MLPQSCLDELRSSWLPHLTESALNRLIDMLEKQSPMLVHGCFTRSVPMGCLASHAAWHHPETEHLYQEAGITWLHKVAGLNPATSTIVKEWDRRGPQDLEFRSFLLDAFRAERARRGSECPNRLSSVVVS